jgi:ABC-type glycerol-3-phosphate transport system permease component
MNKTHRLLLYSALWLTSAVFSLPILVMLSDSLKTTEQLARNPTVSGQKPPTEKTIQLHLRACHC